MALFALNFKIKSAFELVSVLLPCQKISVLFREMFLPAPHLGTFHWIVVKSKNGEKSFHGVC